MEKQKVVFLDRDGVVNVERGTYTFRLEDFKFTDGIWDFVAKYHSLGFKFIIITNQGGISKGLYQKSDVEILNQDIYTNFKAKGFSLLDIYYCPHHHEIENCLCRKPKGLMIERAIYQYNIDKTDSFMIGDSQRDVDAAFSSYIKGVLVKSNCIEIQLDK